MLLELTERVKFAQYCRENAESCRLMSEQLTKIGHVDLAKRERSKAAAYTIVALDLAAGQEYFQLAKEDLGELKS